MEKTALLNLNNKTRAKQNNKRPLPHSLETHYFLETMPDPVISAQNLDYQSASPIRPHKYSFSPSRVLIHFYPALFQIPPGLVSGIHVWQTINGTVTRPEWIHTSVSDKKVWLVKIIKKKGMLPFAEINLQRMVNSEISWAGRIDFHRISSSISHSFPHGSKIDHCWYSTNRSKNKIVKQHEILTDWNAQTYF